MTRPFASVSTVPTSVLSSRARMTSVRNAFRPSKGVVNRSRWCPSATVASPRQTWGFQGDFGSSNRAAAAAAIAGSSGFRHRGLNRAIGKKSK